MNTTLKRNEMIRQRARGRVRGKTISPEFTDELIDSPEASPESVEALLDEFEDEEAHRVTAPIVNPAGTGSSHLHVDEEPGQEDADTEMKTGHGQDIADIWMLQGGKTPLLSPAQEILLAKRILRGDKTAKEELINANVRLVASVARRYQGRGLPLEDLMQEGLIGLMRAIDKYNHLKGYRFSTYATFWIRQSITRALANQGRSIRLPAHVVDAIGRIARVRDELFQRLGRPPTRSEVAGAAGLTEKKLIQLLRNAAQPVSLESPVGADGESHLGEFIPAGEESSPADRVFRHLVREELEHALNSLTPREKEVIVLRYGLSGESAHTLEETGRFLHITRERARQIESKALEKLRRPYIASRLIESVG